MSNLNWKGIAFYVIIAIVLVIVICCIIPYSNPIKTVFAKLFAGVSFPDLGTNGLLTSIKNLVTDNVATIAGVGITAIPLGYAYIKSYMSKKKAEAELQAQQEISNLQSNKTATEISNLKKKLQDYEDDTTTSELQKTLGETKTYSTTLEGKIKALEGQLAEAQKQPAFIAESLWAKSGGQTIEIDGVKYRIIEKTTKQVL